MATFISLEDHFVSKAMLAGSQNLDDFAFHLWPTETQDKLRSLEKLRLEDMDSGEIALQVVSGIPCSEPFETCKQTNDQLAEAIKTSGGRLAGFATVPVGEPEHAANELERCARELGFVGVLIPNHAHGRYFDTDEYRQFWSRAEQLDLPVYLHPCPPTDAVKSLYQGNYPAEVATILSVGGWGWHADVAVHFIKLYASGLFDAHPKLKIVLGHAGEMLPYMIARIDARLTKGWGARQRDLKTVWAENVWVTISGFWDFAPFVCLLRSVAMDRILFSVDYPFEKNEAGRDFMTKVRDSGLVSEKEWQMIAFRNAEALLRIARP